MYQSVLTSVNGTNGVLSFAFVNLTLDHFNFVKIDFS